MKKILAAALAAAMALSMAACSSGSGDGSSSTGGNSSTNQEEGGKLSGSVVYWAMWQETEPQAEILKAAIEQFKTICPSLRLKIMALFPGRNLCSTIPVPVDL